MKPKTKIWLAALMAFVLLGGLFLLMGKWLAPPKEPAAPALAGQTVPAQLFKIDFTKRYDLICSGSGNGALVYRNCRILGFTGGGVQAARPQYYSDDTDTFDKWVVLELPDLRHAFLPPSQIEAFEEAKSPTKKPSQ